MDAGMCLKKLQYVGVLEFATADSQGNPQVRCISAFTMRRTIYIFSRPEERILQGAFGRRESPDSGYTKYKEMIRLSA